MAALVLSFVWCRHVSPFVLAVNAFWLINNPSHFVLKEVYGPRMHFLSWPDMQVGHDASLPGSARSVIHQSSQRAFEHTEQLAAEGGGGEMQSRKGRRADGRQQGRCLLYAGRSARQLAWGFEQQPRTRPTARCVLRNNLSLMMNWCLMSSDVMRHIRDKLWPMPKHGAINLYVHGNQKAR